MTRSDEVLQVLNLQYFSYFKLEMSKRAIERCLDAGFHFSNTDVAESVC